VRIYVESAPVIYTVEQVAPFAQAVNQRLAASGVVIVSSELTRMECLVLPLRNNDAALVANFDTWFNHQVAELVPFSAALFRRAADIRAQHNFKTPDALHLSAALESACDLFLTNDAQLTRFTAITVEVV
jgi:predicted nucleic acid-binding protein